MYTHYYSLTLSHSKFILDRERSPNILHAYPKSSRYSTVDWFHDLTTMPKSRLLKRVKNVILVNFIWSIIVYTSYQIIKFQSPGSRCHSLLGFALGLLLVFRTTAAYNRYDESGKLWEKALNHLRNIGRTITIFSDVMEVSSVERIMKLLVAFPLVLQEYVQGYHSPSLLKKYLTRSDMEKISKHINRPHYILNTLSMEIRSLPDVLDVFTEQEKQALQDELNALSAVVGGCEKIVQTPVPLTYARHTSRFLSLFCLSMPIALVGELGAYIVPFMSFVSWALYGIQEIGLMIEEPFQRTLRLEIFANTIRRDLSDLVHVSNISRQPLNITSPGLVYVSPYSTEEMKYETEHQEGSVLVAV